MDTEDGQVSRIVHQLPDRELSVVLTTLDGITPPPGEAGSITLWARQYLCPPGGNVRNEWYANASIDHAGVPT